MGSLFDLVAAGNDKEAVTIHLLVLQQDARERVDTTLASRAYAQRQKEVHAMLSAAQLLQRVF
jgi:hypothetical protein